MKKNNKGFTLAELLIVVAVIAVLVAVAIPTFANQLEKSRQAVDVANLRGAYAAAQYALQNLTEDSDGKIQIPLGTEYGSNGEVTDHELNTIDPASGLTCYYDPESGELIKEDIVKNDNDLINAKHMKGYMQGTPDAKVVADWSGITAISSDNQPKVQIGYGAAGAHNDVTTIASGKGGIIQVKFTALTDDLAGDNSRWNVEIQFVERPTT